MSNKKIAEGLIVLGFTSGWVITDQQITLWENDLPIPEMESILKASEKYVEPELSVADKLAIVGLNLDDLKTALGL